MKTRNLAVLGLALMGFPICFAAEPPSCLTAREFVTALEYLRDQTDFKIPENTARDVAAKVASGCTGAAKRFIEVSRLLAASGLSADDSVRTGMEFAPRTDAEASAFLTVFRYAFLSEYLDLDMRSSLGLARSLTTEFQGDVLAVSDDFRALVDFCIGEKIGLPRPECAIFAAVNARKGQTWSGGIAQPFIRVFDFLANSKRGPQLTTGQALKLTGDIIGVGPDSADNFIVGYKYATAKRGLRLPSREAIGFAINLTMSKRGLKKD